MREPQIILQRLPDEEPHQVHLILTATNGDFSGSLSYYCNTTDLITWGQAFKNFTTTSQNPAHYQTGSINPVDRWAYFLSIRAYVISSEQCALEIIIQNTEEKPNEGSCTFSISTESSAINALGELLITFSALAHTELQWSPTGDSYVTN